MNEIVKRAGELKQAFTSFVLGAEDDLAIALETYIAKHSKAEANSQNYDIAQNDRLVDTFAIEGKVGDRTPLDLFVASQPNLAEGDRQLIKHWQQSFIALFEVQEILPDSCKLMNWLTAKHYLVKAHNSSILTAIEKLKIGEILLARIAPVKDMDWMFSGHWTQLGILGKPKLAVAIGNFKQNYKESLYKDAPDLLEQSWQSVEKYHQDFLDFFGSDEINLSGYELGKKLAKFQEKLTEKQLESAGIDSSKSLAEIVQESGMDREEIAEMAETFGIDSKTASKVLTNKNAVKMVVPKIELPDSLKKAEQVTVLAHPRWGQMFLKNYTQLQKLLDSDELQAQQDAEKIIGNYLTNPQINTYIWQRLAQKYPKQLEKLLQTHLARPQLQLDSDLNAVLQEFHKPLEPDLPEIASVPLHLHNLFQDALAEVNKSKANKTKTKAKSTKGFK